MSNAPDIFYDAPPITAAQVDCEAVRRHVEMLHRLAAGQSGKFVVASYGDDVPAVHLHFAIGDVDGMTDAMVEMAAHRNVYVPLALARSDLPPQERGKLSDYIGAFGIVADFDDADAAQWRARLPIEPDYVLETSAAHFQAFYFFRESRSIEEVGELSRRLQIVTKADHCVDAIHVWRIAGTLNWPSAKKKLKQGRSPEPQQVRVVIAWDGTSRNGDQLDAVLPALPIATTPPSSPAIGGEGFDIDAEFAKLPETTRDLIVNGPEAGADRSGKFLELVAELKPQWPLNALISLFEKYPDGIAAKYQDRIAKETARVYNKPTTPSASPEPRFTPQVAASSSVADKPVSGVAPTLRIPADLARDIQTNGSDPATQQRFISWLTRGRMSVKEALCAWIGGFHPALFPGLRRLSEIAIGREPPWLVANWIPRSGIVMIVGDPGAGKTPIAVDIGLSIATGKNWQRQHKVTSGPVVFLAVENPRSTAGRVMAARKHRGDSDDAPFYLYSEPVNFLQPTDIAKVLAFCRGIEAEAGQRVACIVVDTYANATAGADEDKARDANIFIANVIRLRSEIGATVLFTHHFGKDKARGARGSTVLNAAADTVLEVNRGVLKGMKQRDGDIDKLHAAFTILPVQIGTLEREDGMAEPVTNVALTWEGQPDFVPFAAQSAEFERLNPNAEKALGVLKELCRSSGQGVSAEDWRKEYFAKHPISNSGNRTRAWKAIRDDLKAIVSPDDFGHVEPLGGAPTLFLPQGRAAKEPKPVL